MKPAFSVRGRSDVFIGPAAEILPDVLPAGRVVAVSDAAVAELHGRLLAPYETLLVGRGEEHKTLRTVETLCRRLIGMGADRKTFILGVGGGIVTDVAGFAASIYMRGLPFGFVSTTLLGQVDASVGGKNGVNVDGYKNMAGTFTQPRFVVCDPALLRTLPEREFRAGLAEVVKAEIVERDEYEAGDRRKLNLGHTLGHAIEKCSDAMNHGEAVAVGTALAADAAVRLGVLAPADRDRIRGLLARLGFDLTPPVPVTRLLQEVGKDKKSEEGVLRVVFPTGIGGCEVRPMTRDGFAALFA